MAATSHAMQMQHVVKIGRTVAQRHSLEVLLPSVMQRRDCGLLSISRGTVARWHSLVVLLPPLMEKGDCGLL